MLSYKEALEKILDHSFPLRPQSLPLRKCLGLAAAKDLSSPEPFPSFDNSAVDGYAIRFGASSNEFKVRGEIPAGKSFREKLKSGEAVQILTGAPVPKGTDTVVMQEYVERRNGSLLLNEGIALPGQNIRFRGEDFQKGRILARKGTLLGPAHLAVLRTVGYEKVLVYPSACAAILTTGDELLRKGGKLKKGKIRDSNSILLESLVKKAGAIPQVFPAVGDDVRQIRTWVRKGLKSDLLLIAGGVSVGKYDYVKQVLKQEGVREIFWKVNIKPGKPLFFGRKRRTLVFGLPGNPVSAYVTFEEFVKPALCRMLGRRELNTDWKEGRLTRRYKNGSRFHFVRVHCIERGKELLVMPLPGQGSHMIGELASANGLLRVEPDAVLKKNQKIKVSRIGEE